MTDLATIVAAAAAALTAAQDAQVEANDAHVTAKEDNKAFTNSVAEAKTNLKVWKDVVGKFTAETTEADKAKAAEGIAGWEAELLKREAAVVTNKALIASTKETLKAADKALKEAKKAHDKANKPAKETVAKEARVEQNGMKHPVGNGPSATVWAIFDAVTAEKGAPAAITDVLEKCIAAGVRKATSTSAYAHWRKYHGITGRVTGADHAAKEAAKVAEKAAKEAKKVADKAAKEAEKAAAKATKDAEAAAAKAAAEAAAAAAAAEQAPQA